MSPHLPPPFAGPSSFHRCFASGLLWLLLTAAQRGCFSGSVVPRPGWLATVHGRSPLLLSLRSRRRARQRACDLASAGDQSSGLAGKWTVAPGGLIFRVRESSRVGAYNGAKRVGAGRRNLQIHTLSFYLFPLALAGLMKSLGCVFCCD